jgi:hypothetical protein
MTTLLIALGIWLVVSLALAPLVGYFLSAAGQRSAKKDAKSAKEADVQEGSLPHA